MVLATLKLLTLKAYHLIVTADVILYDRLVSPEILEYAASANDKNNNNNNNNYNVSDSNNDNNEGKGLMLFVGKRSGFHTRTQDEIHDLILEFANAGATVVRLKGGDPLVFGRGGEEVNSCAKKDSRSMLFQELRRRAASDRASVCR